MFGLNEPVRTTRSLLPPQPLRAAELRQNIALALNSDASRVSIEQFRFSPNRRSARCWGICAGKRFFAKTLLIDPYPVNPHVSVPWKEPAATLLRSVQEQIEAEWNATHRLRELTGLNSVPALLGKSEAAKTIVWEQVTGVRVNHSVKSARWVNSKGNGMTKAVRQSGEWLRRLHTASSNHSQTICLDSMLQRMRALIRDEGTAGSEHSRAAVELVENAVAQIGSTHLNLPGVLAHGDFMLANLLWAEDSGQTYVVDFENVAGGDLCQDLLTMVFDLRSQLLNPLIPKRAIAALEESFWQGYGAVDERVLLLLTAVASARVLYFHLPRALARRREQGTVASVAASLYKSLLEPSMIARCLNGLQS
jgi:aminoglycoside phosphotransferase